MSKLTVIVNDVHLDLFEGAEDDFYITEQIHDLTNLQTRNASFARTLSVPKTPTNQAALKDSGPVFPNERKSIVRLPCQILFKGVPYVNNAQCSYAVDDGSYNLEFSFKSYDFFERIQGQLISELEWSDLNFTFDQIGWNNNRNQTKDLVTALAQWHSSQDLNDAVIPTDSSWRLHHNLDFSGFHIYLKSIARRIVEQQGFVFDDSFMLNEGDYETLALACPVTRFANYRELGSTPISGFVTNTVIQSESTGAQSLTARIVFDDTTSSGGFYNGTTEQWEFTGYATVDFILTISGQYISGGGGQQCELRIVKNTTIIASIDVSDQTQFDETIVATTNAVPGDVAYAELFILRQGTCELDIGNNFKVQESGLNIDRDIIVKDYIPRIFQTDFLQSLAAYFNAVIDTDEITNTVTLKPYDDIIADTEQDLTSNADLSRDEERAYSLPYFQESIFKYSDSDTIRTDTFGVFYFGSKLLEKRGVLVELEFGDSDNSLWPDSLYTRASPNAEYPCYPIEKKSDTPLITYTSDDNGFTFASDTDFHIGDYIESNVKIGGTGDKDLQRIATKINDTQGTIFATWNTNAASAPCAIYSLDKD